MDPKWEPFIRKDIYKLHVIWSMPWYCTFWPRFIIGWGNGLLCAVVVLLATACVKDKTKLKGCRLWIVNSTIWFSCYVGMIISGHYKVKF